MLEISNIAEKKKVGKGMLKYTILNFLIQIYMNPNLKNQETFHNYAVKVSLYIRVEIKRLNSIKNIKSELLNVQFLRYFAKFIEFCYKYASIFIVSVGINEEAEHKDNDELLNFAEILFENHDLFKNCFHQKEAEFIQLFLNIYIEKFKEKENEILIMITTVEDNDKEDQYDTNEFDNSKFDSIDSWIKTKNLILNSEVFKNVFKK